MHAGASGAAFEGVARDPAIRAERIRDRLSMVARLRYGLSACISPFWTSLPDRFRYLFNAAGPSQKIESNYSFPAALVDLKWSSSNIVALFNPPDNEGPYPTRFFAVSVFRCGDLPTCLPKWALGLSRSASVSRYVSGRTRAWLKTKNPDFRRS